MSKSLALSVSLFSSSVAVQVNQGPLAYANSFLDPKLCDKYDYDRVEDLRDMFR